MKIEKITENKIRIILNFSELPNNGNFESFINDDVNTNKFFLSILDKAEKDFGFKTENCKLLIEAYSSIEDNFVLTITKCSSKKTRTLKLSKKEKKLFSQPLTFEFFSFEEYCLLCELLQKEKIPINNIANKVSLYLYNNTYYLIFSKLNLSYNYFKKLFSYISEFAIPVKHSGSFSAKVIEYGKPITIKNAFRTGAKYFIREQ